jgi:hypothetical protein
MASSGRRWLHSQNRRAVSRVGPQRAHVEAQEFYQGGWNANTATGCIHLSRASQVTAIFTSTTPIPYRMRADYIRSHSDVSNLPTVTYHRQPGGRR